MGLLKQRAHFFKRRPPSGAIASDQDLADIYAYLKLLPSPLRPDQIPLLQH
jgi:hypothetical protein